jgi:ABC-type antimicrobial peptide transport system permease subunit
LVVALLVVGGGAVAAGVVPARRASRVDPNTVLHQE